MTLATKPDCSYMSRNTACRHAAFALAFHLTHWLQDSASGSSQSTVASSTSTPPLLHALVHSQEYPQDQPCDAPVATFFMHSSSMTPLKFSELESSSPSHPLFMHTSQQQPAPSSKQSPTCLQHRQIRAQQSPVRSWKSLRPENRATLDGSSNMLMGIQGTAGVGPAPQAHDSSLQPCIAGSVDTVCPQETAVHVQHLGILGKGRAGSSAAPVQMPFSGSQFPVQGVQSVSTPESHLDTAEVQTTLRASSKGSSSQPASNLATASRACTGCSPPHAHRTSAKCSISLHAPNSTSGTSCCSHSNASPGHTNNAPGIAADSFRGMGADVPSSSMQAAHVADAAAGSDSSTAGLGASATASCAEYSSGASQSSFPFLVGCHRVRADPPVGCHSSASELSALNSADLAYLGEEETSVTLPAGILAPLRCSSRRTSSMDTFSGQQAASESPDAWMFVQDAATLVSSGHGHVPSKVRSGTARTMHGVRGHGASGSDGELLQNLGSDVMVLSGSDSELRDQSSSSVPVDACWVSETSVHVDSRQSVVVAKAVENANTGRLQSLESAVAHGYIAELPGSEFPRTSCDSLYEDDWEA